MDITVIIGFFGGAAMLILGQALEGGNIGQLLQVTAAMRKFPAGQRIYILVG